MEKIDHDLISRVRYVDNFLWFLDEYNTSAFYIKISKLIQYKEIILLQTKLKHIFDNIYKIFLD